MKIGHLLRDSLSNILATKICNSACFIIYSGVSFNEAQNKYKELDVIVRNYLEEMYVDTSLIEDMFSTSSGGVKFIPPKEMMKLVPQTSPVAEEWLASNCDALTDKEAADLNPYLNPFNIESLALSEVYLSYLQNKRKNSLSVHRASFLKPN